MQFNQPDSVIPNPYNTLDWNRYSYARYNPLKYTDPSGHFTRKAIWDYLLNYYDGDRKAANEALQDWKSNTDWWDMITTAQAGDNLFGYHYGTQFNYKFEGEGQDVLAGISGSKFGLEAPSLDEIQGWKPEKDSNKSRSTYNVWMGFYRMDARGKPSFWIRSGYQFTQNGWEPWATKGVDAAAGTATGGAVAGWQGAVVGFGSAWILPAASDVLNMGEYDVNVRIRPGDVNDPFWYLTVDFNFQLQSDDTWTLEGYPWQITHP